MSKGHLDNATIDIPCPSCSHTFEKSVGWIKSHRSFACPACGAGFKADEFIAEFKKVDKSIADFQRTIKRASMSLTFRL